MQALGRACQHTLRLAGDHRKLWLPFLVVASVEALFLGLVWLAPHEPFSRLLAPPIRFLFSDRVLHYPWHLWFLYHAMKHTHLAASLLIGAFMTGIACEMVRQTWSGRPLSFREALINGRVRYGTVLAVWLSSWGVARLTTLGLALLPLGPARALGAGIAVTLLLQALLVYAIPAAVFDNLSWWQALSRSAREAIRDPVNTLLLIMLPSAAVLTFTLAASPAHVARWMMQTAPEVAFAWVAARLLVWTFADVLLTVTAAHLWWARREQRPQAASPHTKDVGMGLRFSEGSTVVS
jgi:hypothetical protein